MNNDKSTFVSFHHSFRGGVKHMELSYSFHLGNDKNKSIKARREAKNTLSGTTNKSNNAI